MFNAKNKLRYVNLEQRFKLQGLVSCSRIKGLMGDDDDDDDDDVMMMMMMMMMNCFVVWFTEERHYTLFPSGAIVRHPHHCEYPAHCKQDLNLCRT